MPTTLKPLRIRLTRLTSTHHRFEAIGAEGGVTMRELETRSFLTHDLVHYALESEAGLMNSFYGRLARGAEDYALSSPSSGEAMETERVVGPLQTAIQNEVDVEAFVVRLIDVQRENGREPPAWLNADLIERAIKRLRGLQGRWRATPFGETMELLFPPPP